MIILFTLTYEWPISVFLCKIILILKELMNKKYNLFIIHVQRWLIFCLFVGCNQTDRWGTSCENQCGCGVGALYCDSLTGCVCDAGWSGVQCAVDIDECLNSSTNSCGENSRCVNREPFYVCQCDNGYVKDQNSQSHRCTGNGCYL